MSNGCSLKDAVADALADARALTGELGLRPRYRVCIVHVHWSGGAPGRGDRSVTATELAPAPRVEFRERRELGPGGALERGTAVLTELEPMPAAVLTRLLTPRTPAEEVYLEIALEEPEAPVRRYVVSEPPERRAHDWRLVLRAQGPSEARAPGPWGR